MQTKSLAITIICVSIGITIAKRPLNADITSHHGAAQYSPSREGVSIHGAPSQDDGSDGDRTHGHGDKPRGNGGGGRHGHGHGHGHGGPGRAGILPSFVTEAGIDATKAFVAIFKNFNQTFDEQKAAFESWGVTYNATEQVEEWYTNITTNSEATVQDIVSKMSVVIQKAAELKKANPDQTIAEYFEALTQWLNTTDENTRTAARMVLMIRGFTVGVGQGYDHGDWHGSHPIDGGYRDGQDAGHAQWRQNARQRAATRERVQYGHRRRNGPRGTRKPRASRGTRATHVAREVTSAAPTVAST